MTSFAVQYLEYAPSDATPAKVRERLRQAFELLPISIVIPGWDLPRRLEEAVAKETARHNATLYRWHPLLASDAGFALPNEWQTINLHGAPVPGFKGLPEFTFICPNRTDVQEWIAERIEVAAQRGIYQGLFFDRMRFPSPAENPERQLACFCQYCQRIASDSGLDLEAVRRQIESLFTQPGRAKAFTRALFSPTDNSLLESFFTFRFNSITRVIEYAAKIVRSHGLSIGLDCFSPTLTRMVGQDLSALNNTCDWIKLMTYPRVFGPAGLPFELHTLSNWLTTKYSMDETEAIKTINEASGLSVSMNGLDSGSIAHEIQSGRAAGISNLLAGIALVEVEGVHMPTLEQIRADTTACQDADADGLVLSWDLWHIPFNYISAINESYK
jgi:putative glycosyl hydrolase protein